MTHQKKESNVTSTDTNREKLDLISPHYEEIAAMIARSLSLKPDERVLVSGGVHQFDLLAKIAFHISLLGAFADLQVSNDELIYRRAMELPIPVLDRPINQHDRYLASLYDASIHIDPMLDESLLRDMPAERLGLGRERSKVMSDIAKARNRRSIFMAWPVPHKAKTLNMSFVDYEKLFLDALLIDQSKMATLSQFLYQSLKNGGDVKISSSCGTDLTFKLNPKRRVMIDTGCFTEEMILQGDITKNLPCGEVYSTAVEDTVEGIAIFDRVIVDGKPIESLKLTFQQGRLVEYSAASGEELFEQVYSNAKGDRDRIGEFGIGTNPRLLKPIGHTLLDEKIYGSIHLALGENRMYGGRNNATIHWDLVMLEPTVIIDSRLILDQGDFPARDAD